jgi:hypothetical protein
MTGDGGNSGIDVANRNLRYHTYFGPQGDVNFHGNNPNTWDWFMDPLIFSGEAASFYVPFIADPKVSGGRTWAPSTSGAPWTEAVTRRSSTPTASRTAGPTAT